MLVLVNREQGRLFGFLPKLSLVRNPLGPPHHSHTIPESGILSYGEIYTALGNHGQAMLAASCEGFTDVTTKVCTPPTPLKDHLSFDNV